MAVTWNMGPRVILLTVLIVFPVSFVSTLDVQVVTIATNSNDGLRRYLKTANKYKYDVKVYGMGETWEGGDIARYAGGGHKVNILKAGLEEFAGREDLLLLFTDSYDVVFTNSPEEVWKRFQKLGARVVFSAEGFCWPDAKLQKLYPKVKPQEKRYLNSGGFIGYAKDIYEIVSHRDIRNNDDDQLYYTNVFLDEKLREKWNIKLDTKSEIFQNLNGALEECEVKFKGDQSYVYNTKSGTIPIVIHGNGPIKVEFNGLTNYIPDAWTPNMGCLTCADDTISLEGLKEADYPTVTMALMVELPTPFLDEHFNHIKNLAYPKSKIHLFVHNKVELHSKQVDQFLDDIKGLYSSVVVVSPDDNMSEAEARNWALQVCAKKSSQYFFNVDSIAQITHVDTLKLLIEQNRTILGPMLPRKYKLWSNFWGGISKNGYYARSNDYMDIVEGKKIGVWNVPFMTATYLVHGSMVPSLLGAFTPHTDEDPDMAFCHFCREKGWFMHVTNRHNFGYQVDPENYETNHLHNDMYEIFNNPWDWELKYIHENYSMSLDTNYTLPMPCPDVFWFPIISETFTTHLVEEMENFGKWSGGRNSHKDDRLATGYENVPTVDIHMNQIGIERHWLYFLKKYVSPLQQRAFEGYFNDPPHATMNFVVRYKPDEQPLLRPHHDSSTFTINIALNTPHKDFEGGGCRFLRYDCNVTDTKRGWMLMHPGRLTHYHEGLPTTAGTRYIMVSFIDP